MKTNDLLTMTTVALGTAALTVLTLWPGTLDAGNDDQLPAPIAKPKLLSRGVEMTLATAHGKIPKAGDIPVLELTAVSHTNAPARICARVTMNISSPADVFSRTIRMPTVLWVDNREFTVRPGEKKTIQFVCSTNLPPNKFISVSLQDVQNAQSPAPSTSLPIVTATGAGRPGAPAMIMLNFSTAIPSTKPELVLSR